MGRSTRPVPLDRPGGYRRRKLLQGDRHGRIRQRSRPHPVLQPLDGRLRIRSGRLAARRALRRRDAPARQSISRTHGQARPERAEHGIRTGAGRPRPAAPRQLRPAAHQAAGRRGNGSDQAPLPGRGPARRARPGHRRIQARKRDRRGRARGASLLFRDLPAAAHARPDRRRRDDGRGAVPGRDHRAAPQRRRQAGRSRQLPGGLADHDDRRGPAGTVRPHHRRRRPAVVLVRLARHEPHALCRRPAGRQLAHRADQRPGRRQVRRRLAGAELREPESGEHAVVQAVQPVLQCGHRGVALPELREMVGRPRLPERPRNPVHRRQPVRRQPPGHGGPGDLRRHPHRPAQHPVAHRGVLLQGRQHHAPAAGAGLDSRPVPERGRGAGPRPDHRLRRA
ncbi:hypothetical protein AVE30378_05692 [Achromobacter veterisilvae]|uniref:Uncharacterized protein n=1 Tax=Achromobacter veterisilvae TaxID=2069367 RepID=A0A446CZQ8_9BURK|nr:hypothetical protein AVE30378_05692 [Achromobacter veterisilvae]